MASRQLHLLQRICPILACGLLTCGMGADAKLLTHGRPNADQGPTVVEYIVYIADIDEINSADQTFTANVFFFYRWNDPSLVHEGPGNETYNADEIWHPYLQILNQQRIWSSLPDHAVVAPDGTVTAMDRVWGSFSQPLRLQSFPFDEHRINLTFVSVGHGLEDVAFVPREDSASGIATNLSVPDFEITDFRIEPKPYVALPGDAPVAGFEASVLATRESDYYVYKVLLPLILILAMSWVVFWIDPSQGGTQISVATTTMLTLIAYRFAVGADLPRVAYFTRMDSFILVSTVLVFVSLLEVVATSYLASQDQLRRARWIDRVARIVIPGSFVLVTLKLVF